MDDEACVAVPYTDSVAERTQAYMWLLESISSIGKHNYPQNAELIREGTNMLVSVRHTIEISTRATVLKGIPGGK